MLLQDFKTLQSGCIALGTFLSFFILSGFAWFTVECAVLAVEVVKLQLKFPKHATIIKENSVTSTLICLGIVWGKY